MSKQMDLDALRKAFGQRVRALRKKKGMSQMALGELSGLDYNYIGQAERGERNISLEAIGRLAKGLDVGVAELFIFSSEQAIALDPELVEILTLLEGKGPKALARVKELVEIVVRWEGE